MAGGTVGDSQRAGGRAGTWHLFWIQVSFAGSLQGSRAAQIGATKIDGADLSRPIGVAAALPRVRGLHSNSSNLNSAQVCQTASSSAS